jgi:hypothetical protein
LSTSIGTIGSAVNLDSIIQNKAKKPALRMIGVKGISGDARLNSKRKIEVA